VITSGHTETRFRILIECSHLLRQFGVMPEIIMIDECDVLSTAMIETDVLHSSVSANSSCFNEIDAFILKGTNDFPAVVCGAIVHHNQFPVLEVLREYALNGLANI